MTFHIKDYPSREAQWLAALKWWRQPHTTWCMATPTVGVPIGPCDCKRGSGN